MPITLAPLAQPVSSDVQPALTPRAPDARITGEINTYADAMGLDPMPAANPADRVANFAPGTALVFNFSNRRYDASDAFVQRAPIRREIVESLQTQFAGRKVQYEENMGLVEYSGGWVGIIPVGSVNLHGFSIGSSVSYGFIVNTLLRYREAKPVITRQDNINTDQPDLRKVRVPLHPQMACQMQEGQEIELTGQGRLKTNVGLATRAGFGIDQFLIAGVGNVVGCNTSLTEEFSLSVLKLNKPNCVRVTLHNLNQEDATALAVFRAGVVLASTAITGPGIGGGFLSALTDRFGAPNFEQLINNYTAVNANVSGTATHRGLRIGSWDLDLSDPTAQEVYQELLMLNVFDAHSHAQSGHPCVKEVDVHEDEGSLKLGANLIMLGSKLFLSEVLQAEREGCISGELSKQVYRESIFSKSRRNLFTGSKTVTWDAVSIKPQEGQEEPYLHLTFQHTDYFFNKGQVDQMLHFADAMMVEQRDLTDNDQPKLAELKSILDKRAEVKIESDIYFTAKGIDNIDKADQSTAAAAFLSATAALKQDQDLSQDEKALLCLKDFSAALRSSDMRAWRLNSDQMRTDYATLTQGRNIDADTKLYDQAQHFGKAVEHLTNSRDGKQVRHFFKGLGRLHGFDYAQAIAALSRLATPEETLVHKMSITSGPYSICNHAEAAIESPRDRMVDALYAESRV